MERNRLFKEYQESDFGGYDEDLFVKKLPRRYQCPVCMMAMRNPVSTSCGHRFCETCLTRSIPIRESDDSSDVDGNEVVCPCCREFLNETGWWFPDIATKREILSLEIQCANSNEATGLCNWMGELRGYPDHFLNCQNRIVPCDHCQKEMRFWLREDHVKECPSFPEDCPEGCGLTLPREKVNSHVQDDCEEAMTYCPYKKSGCDFHDKRCKLKDHLKEFAVDHSKRAEENLQSTMEEVKCAQDEITDLQAAMLSMVQQEDLKNQLSPFEKVPDNIADLQIEQACVNERMQKFENLHKKNFEDLKTENESLREMIMQLMVSANIMNGRAGENKSMVEQLLDQLSEVTQSTKKMEVKVQEMENDREALNNKIIDLQCDRVSVQEQLKILEKEKESLKETVAKQQKELDMMSSKFQQLVSAKRPLIDKPAADAANPAKKMNTIKQERENIRQNRPLGKLSNSQRYRPSRRALRILWREDPEIQISYDLTAPTRSLTHVPGAKRDVYILAKKKKNDIRVYFTT